MKRCSQCKQEKHLDDFNKDNKAKDGRQSWCRDCQRSPHSRYSHSAYNRSDKGKERYKAYRERRKTRVEARWAVGNAIRDGHLPRPATMTCSCGQPAESYHHHNGYKKEHWLDVIPLCWPCHRAVDEK